MQRNQETLPVSAGGLEVCHMALLALPAFLASAASSSVTPAAQMSLDQHLLRQPVEHMDNTFQCTNTYRTSQQRAEYLGQAGNHCWPSGSEVSFH